MEWNDNIINPKKEKLKFNTLIKNNPKFAEGFYRLAVIYEYLGGYNNLIKAIKYCKKALSLAPCNEAYLAFYVYLNVNFDDKEALKYLVRFIELIPDERDYYTQRIIEKIKYIEQEAILEHMEKLYKQRKHNVAKTIKRWLEIK